MDMLSLTSFLSKSMNENDGARIQAENIIEDCNCSAKTYWNDSTALERAHYRVSTVSAVLAGLSGAAIVMPFVKASPVGLNVCALMSLFASGMSLLLQSSAYTARSEMARSVAGEYDALRKKVAIFRDLELPLLDNGSAVSRVKEFKNFNIEINQKSPNLYYDFSWKKARDGIDAGEAKYASSK